MGKKLALLPRSILLTGMKISPYKYSEMGWPGCWHASSKMPLQAILNNCQNNVKTTKLFQQVEFEHMNSP